MLRSTRKEVVAKIREHILTTMSRRQADYQEELPKDFDGIREWTLQLFCKENNSMEECLDVPNHCNRLKRWMLNRGDFSPYYDDVRVILADWLQQSPEEQEKYGNKETVDWYFSLIARELLKNAKTNISFVSTGKCAGCGHCHKAICIRCEKFD